ncbi:MAG: heavy metal translocating P-type ATPase [Lachnospiraceae bacterium]|nr:heavy metal translocating P-type ATPase [Lachnospiraceae bacterium]
MKKKQKKMLARIIIAAVMVVVLNLIPVSGILRLALYLAAYLVIGYDILRKAGKGILNRRMFDENFLMAVATIGAFALAIYSGSGDYNEAIAVMLFYQIGELFQSYAVGKSRRNISALMDIRPDYANVERNGVLEQVDPDEVEVGSIIIVQPGEKVPIDGIVTEGASSLNTSALTGESLPRDVKSGDEIISGCINMTGVLKIRTTKEFGESTVSKILELVENSSSRKSKSENFISKFARVYTPAVCYGALALAFLPPIVQMLFLGQAAQWDVWIYRALTFLVISCPCALVISIPLSFFAGIGGASKEGVLIKGSNYMETLSQAKYVVFDKTGTLTQGVFEVTAVHHNEMDEKMLLEYAALAECASSHPISRSLQNAYGKEIDRSRVSNIQEISGHGITAKVDGHEVAAGNSKLMKRLGIDYHECSSVGTIIHMAVDGKYEGHIVISDVMKPHAKEAIANLKKAGVQKIVMLTGDSKKVADAAASDLGIDEVYSELLPADKVAKVEELLSKKPKKDKLAFVGDGINDAPVLTRSDIGIAMGALGSDAAIEAADVVLMDDDPLKISKAIRISRKCLGIVYQNIVFALVIKFACLGLGAVGIANMWFAIFADVGVMILAVLNAIRALRVHRL